jgi:hypothetical protein
MSDGVENLFDNRFADKDSFSAHIGRKFFMKLKKDERWENRTRLVWGLQPSVTMLKDYRTFSDDNPANSSSPNSVQNLLMIHL